MVRDKRLSRYKSRYIRERKSNANDGMVNPALAFASHVQVRVCVRACVRVCACVSAISCVSGSETTE